MDDKLTPIYTTSGDAEAYMQYSYLFNLQGEWIGFINSQKEVFSVLGKYVGYLADGPRILRKRSYSFDRPTTRPPEPPPIIVKIPPTAPLPPMMSEITFSEVDVLEEEPDRLLPRTAAENLTDLD
ncbi:MAG: hypothetical protein H6636_00080 [Anaerolineales bacterium]|nr:hypothetical protein [Anaerolineales bacterium]